MKLCHCHPCKANRQLVHRRQQASFSECNHFRLNRLQIMLRASVIVVVCRASSSLIKKWQITMQLKKKQMFNRKQSSSSHNKLKVQTYVQPSLSCLATARKSGVANPRMQSKHPNKLPSLYNLRQRQRMLQSKLIKSLKTMTL